MPILQIDPVAFHLGSWPVNWYGLIIGLGMFVGYFIYADEAKKKGLDEELTFDLFFWVIIIGFLGARLYYVVFTWEYYAQNPGAIFAIWQGGLAIYGGVIAGALTLLFFARRYKLNLMTLFDVAVPGLMVGQLIGRWGNFMNQEAHGWAVPRATLEGLFIPEWIIDQMYIDGSYYHPTFLYESLWLLLGFVIILILRGRENFLKNGEVTAFYLIWYGVGRFFIEGMRTDSLYLGPIRVSQLVSLLMILIGIGIIVHSRQEGKQVPYYSTNRKTRTGV